METEKIYAKILECEKRIDKAIRRIDEIHGVVPCHDADMSLRELIEPALNDDGSAIEIPLLGRSIAIDAIDNEEDYTWLQAMDYCKGKGLELPSRDDALILIWQLDKINALLRSLGKDEISKESWFWTKIEHPRASVPGAWHWRGGSWNNPNHYLAKTFSYAVVPFFAID